MACSKKSCYSQHEYVMGTATFADFFLGDYIIEYYLKADGSFDHGQVVKRMKAGENKYHQTIIDLEQTLDFSKDALAKLKRIEDMLIFK